MFFDLTVNNHNSRNCTAKTVRSLTVLLMNNFAAETVKLRARTLSRKTVSTLIG